MNSLFVKGYRYIKKNLHKSLYNFIFLIESISVIFAYYISFFFIKKFVYPELESSRELLLLGLLIFISWLIISRITTIAILPRTQRYRTLFFRFLQITFIEMFISIVLWSLFASQTVPFILIPIYSGISHILTFIIRIISYSIFKIYRAKGYNSHYVIIIADLFSDSIIEQLINQKEWGFKIKYILSNSKLINAKYEKNIPILKESTDIKELLDHKVIDEVIYCKNTVDDLQIKSLISACNEVGVIFRFQSSLSPIEPQPVDLKTINYKPSFTLVDLPANHFSLMLKTLSDMYFSTIALILLFPVLLIISILIKLNSPGPVFFKQERIGLRGRKFMLYKFRTMVQNAEQIKEKILDQNEVDGPVFKIQRDPRITRIGIFLRKTGIDEIPQLYNVMRGEMSLIGPRPPIESEVAQYKRWQLRRLSVKPGITCTWQVIPNRNDINFEKWMKLDLEYIDNWTLWEDIKLYFKTIRAIFLATGH